jgi:hypothetical protein
MESKIVLELKGGQKIPLLDVEYSIHQPTDQSGKAASPTVGGPIRITKESTEDGTVAEWATENVERRDGTITITSQTTGKVLRTIKFYRAIISEYEEMCSSEGGTKMLESFTIMAQDIDLAGGAKVSNSLNE